MQSPAVYPESTIDQDDVVYPCKGCGEILEEGKAFELAGNRWHIDCFRCNTCGTLLDSDANLLLLGDGSLICNNCTYSCSACNNKIEDLAILTGDQAFCSNCFKCRNCKNKIENLRYARTTQGIFCMSCYESLTQRRRKNRNKQKATNTLNKALPEPPKVDPNQAAFSTNGSGTPTDKISELDSTEPSAKYTSSTRTLNNSRPITSTSREMSSSSLDVGRGFTLPASTYDRTNPTSPVTTMSATVNDPLNDLADGLFVPLVLDPNPASNASQIHELSDHRSPDSKSGVKDYMLGSQSRPSRDYLRDTQHDSRSSSLERKAASPHIAYQEKPKSTPDHIADVMRKRGPSTTASPRISDSQSTSPYFTPQNEFRLQEAPKSKKPGSRGSSNDTRSAVTSPIDGNSRNITPQLDMPIGIHEKEPEQLKSSLGEGFSDRSPISASRNQREALASRPRRGDSLGASNSAVSRKDIPGSSGSILSNIAEFRHERKSSSNSLRQALDANGGMTISRPLESPGAAKSIYDTSAGTPGSASRQVSVTTSDAFVAPRHAPPPPPGHRPSQSNGSLQSSESVSPTHGENGENYEGMLRKMSNAMRGHARSVSDKVVPSPRNQRHPGWPKSPMNGSIDLTTPTSPEGREEYILLRSQLRRAQQRIAELETEKTSLQGIVNNDPEIRQVNTALKEKRSTMAVLDTQREIVVRELEIMTDHLKQMKANNKPFDVTGFKSEVLTDFQSSMMRLKESLGSEIEGLIQKRNDLNNEITTLIQMKDKGFQEYENLSNRNAQLNQHNNELVQSIQDHTKQNPNKTTNGLGLYLGGGPSQIRLDSGNDLKQMMLDSNTTLMQDSEHDSAIITTPHVVKLKQQKPNMLRKGGFLKGIKGMKAALSDKPAQTPTYPTDGTPYSHLQDTGPGAPRTGNEVKNKFGGFFGTDRNGTKHLRTLQHNGSNPSLVNEQPSANQLFGTELSVRCQFENKDIPAIVIRCVQEVELRGMDAEGVYRKSGGSGQVNQVKAGFERNDDYDISDPELEIHAVTSTLKQYFRRLPTPLITFDVYDYVLEAARVEDMDQRAIKLREAVDRLPKAHRDCLEFLIFHLARVTSHERDNLMTPLNLAVVFAPTIMRPSTIEREMMDMSIQRQTVQSLLELNKAIFESAA